MSGVPVPAPAPMPADRAVSLADQALCAVGRLLSDADGNADRHPYDVETAHRDRSVVWVLTEAEILLVFARDALRRAAIREAPSAGSALLDAETRLLDARDALRRAAIRRAAIREAPSAAVPTP